MSFKNFKKKYLLNVLIASSIVFAVGTGIICGIFFTPIFAFGMAGIVFGLGITCAAANELNEMN